MAAKNLTCHKMVLFSKLLMLQTIRGKLQCIICPSLCHGVVAGEQTVPNNNSFNNAIPLSRQTDSKHDYTNNIIVSRPGVQEREQL